MRWSSCVAGLAVALVQPFTGRAAADIMQFESLDLAVAKSELVVRGEVTEITSKKQTSGNVWSKVTVKVAETIKGQKADEVTFLVMESPLAPRQAAWKDMGVELLFCLNATGGKPLPDSPYQGDFALREGNASWAVALNGKPVYSVYSTDFKPLTDAKQIVAAAKAAADAKLNKREAVLGWIADDLLWPCEVLYPDTDRVRDAAKEKGVKLLGDK